jgi:hypothetical protein
MDKDQHKIPLIDSPTADTGDLIGKYLEMVDRCLSSGKSTNRTSNSNEDIDNQNKEGKGKEC